MSKHARIVLSDVMKEASVILRSSHLNRSEAVRRAWKVVKLKLKLAAGQTVQFAFEKADGTVRQAIGLAAKTGSFLINGRGHATPQANFLYFDVEAAGFRSFAKSRILTIA